MAQRLIGLGGRADLWMRRSGPAARPARATDGWGRGRGGLPSDEDWDVWIDWYEDRLRGGSRGEDYELVFASSPEGNGTGTGGGERVDQGELQASGANLPREKIDFHDRFYSRNGSKGRSRMFRFCSRRAQPCASCRPPSVVGTPGYEALVEKVLRGEAFRAVALAE